MPLYLNGTEGVSGINGTNATPAVRGSDTTGNGIFYGTDTVSVATNGTTAVTVDSSQNVGIGTASPARKFHVSGGSAQVDYAYGVSGTSFRILNDATPSNGITLVSEYYGSGSYGPIKFNTGNAEAARIDSSGNLLVGTTTSQGRFTVKSAAASGSAYVVSFGSSTTDNILTLRDDGLFGTGTATNSPYNYTTASAANLFVNSGGNFQRSTSSLRYKTNVETATHGLKEVLELRPVTYNGKNDGDVVFGGLIAEEVDAIGLKEFVVYDDENRPDALAYGNMVSLAFKAIQELSAKLDAAEARIAALEAK